MHSCHHIPEFFLSTCNPTVTNLASVYLQLAAEVLLKWETGRTKPQGHGLPPLCFSGCSHHQSELWYLHLKHWEWTLELWAVFSLL